ncbi:GNAT family N-acetyltransferase [Vibrio rarus]|uniref:GNAT family N-acetyltransferase n=1 Tax=Vibrio rarus TaxID=413403 RepID=UPI0021C42E6D|nr:GNAT family N-acetyltransferase [Vibrio rarus]
MKGHTVIIETTRLTLKALTAEDWPLFYELHRNPLVTQLCFDPPSIEAMKQRFHCRLQAWNTQSTHWLCFVVNHRHSNESIGLTGFCMQDGVAEVGYMFLPSFYGQGFATESLRGLLEWARERHAIDEFLATVTKGNVASEKVLLNSGFTFHQSIANAYCIGGNLYTDHIYRLSLKAQSA